MNCSVFDSSCGRTIIYWKVYCIEDEKLITLQGLYDVLVSSSNDDIKQHVSNHFLEDCKIGTSPEKMYSVDGFHKYECSEGHVCTLRGTQNKA